MESRILIELVPVESARWRGVDAATRLKRLLKYAGRACGWRCVRVTSSMKLDGLTEELRRDQAQGAIRREI